MGCGGSVPESTPILVEENIIDTMGRLKASLEAHHRENDNEDEAIYDNAITDSSTSEERRMGLYSAVLAHQFMTKRVVERDDSTTTKETSIAEDFILKDNAPDPVLKFEQTKVVVSPGDKLDELVLSDILETPDKSNSKESETDAKDPLVDNNLDNTNENTLEYGIENQNDSLEVPANEPVQETETPVSQTKSEQDVAASASTMGKETEVSFEEKPNDAPSDHQDLKDNESRHVGPESESPILNSGSTNVPVSPTRSNSVGLDTCVENPIALLEHEGKDEEKEKGEEIPDKERKSSPKPSHDNSSVSAQEDSDSA
ncbi:uncharacterized protein LOC131880062 [Tigriopus californicus]|nr:uncharacterized protein LOC131880062 [Tigriopus californicus]